MRSGAGDEDRIASPNHKSCASMALPPAPWVNWSQMQLEAGAERLAFE
jgi:hypothetical protein